MHAPIKGQLNAPAWVKYSMVPSGSEATVTRALTGRCEEENLLLSLEKRTLISLSFCLVTISTDLFRCLGSSTNAVNKQTQKRVIHTWPVFGGDSVTYSKDKKSFAIFYSHNV